MLPLEALVLIWICKQIFIEKATLERRNQVSKAFVYTDLMDYIYICTHYMFMYHIHVYMYVHAFNFKYSEKILSGVISASAANARTVSTHKQIILLLILCHLLI